MSTLSIKTDDNSLIHLKQNHLFGWIFALVGLAAIYIPSSGAKVEGSIWVAYVVGGLFTLIGISVALYRLEIKLHLTQRRYQISKGFLPSPKQYSGSLDTLEGLYYQKRWKSSGGKNKTKYLVWQTALKLVEVKQAITLFESRDEQQGRAYFERRAEQLRIATFDHTGDEVVSKEWDQLDQSVGEQLSEKEFTVVSEMSPPEGLEYKASSRGVSYWASPLGLNATSVVGTLFGLPFFIMGLLSSAIGLGLHEALGWDINVSGSMTAAVIVGLVFTVIGGVIIRFSINHAFTRHRFTLSDIEFCHETFRYQKKVSEDRFKLSDIEDFGVRESTASRGTNQVRINGVGVNIGKRKNKVEIFVRTDDKVKSIRGIQSDCAEFIKNVFYQKLRRG